MYLLPAPIAFTNMSAFVVKHILIYHFPTKEENVLGCSNCVECSLLNLGGFLLKTHNPNLTHLQH